ncbi:dispanin subfamily A member 2b-like [Lates japonicus]
MNPEGYPADAVPLQAGRYNVPPGQPGLPAVVQYTTVSVPIEPPKDHIIWSLFSFVHLNPCCLGLAALIHSIKARDRRAAGDLDGSRRHSSTACCLNIWATVVGSIMILLMIIMIIYNLNSSYSYSNNYHYSYNG